VTFSEKVEVRVHEIARLETGEETDHPAELGTSVPEFKKDNNLTQPTTSDSSPATATVPLGSFLG